MLWLYRGGVIGCDRYIVLLILCVVRRKEKWCDFLNIRVLVNWRLIVFGIFEFKFILKYCDLFYMYCVFEIYLIWDFINEILDCLLILWF